MKSKEYVFKAYGNSEVEKPAKIIFNRFPLPLEMFFPFARKDLLDGIDANEISNRELKSIISDKIMKNVTLNMDAGKVDYKLFFDECVEGFQDFEYGEHKIDTVADFWKILPQDAAYKIASEAFEYANEKDEFEMENSKA